MAELCWHPYHKQTSPLALLGVTLEERREQIIRTKPPEEHELRLRLLQPVRGELPAAVLEAASAYLQAEAAVVYTREGREGYFPSRVNRAQAAFDQARATFSQSLRDHHSEIMALHAVECPDCPWDGDTIFPGTGA